MRSGLKTAQGLVLTETWYWDMNDANRAWTKRWQAERAGKIPVHGAVAGVYAETLHYLKAVAALKSAADGKAVVEADESSCRPTIRCSAKATSVPTGARFIRPISSR